MHSKALDLQMSMFYVYIYIYRTWPHIYIYTYVAMFCTLAPEEVPEQVVEAALVATYGLASLNSAYFGVGLPLVMVRA